MPKPKKRLNKAARAAQKLLNDSKLLAAKAAREAISGEEFDSSVVTPRTNTTANKPRPHKKRG